MSVGWCGLIGIGMLLGWFVSFLLALVSWSFPSFFLGLVFVVMHLSLSASTTPSASGAGELQGSAGGGGGVVGWGCWRWEAAGVVDECAGDGRWWKRIGGW